MYPLFVHTIGEGDAALYVVIVGCGKLGSTVASLLSRDKHNLVVIDKDSSAFQLLDPGFNGITLLGNGIDVDIQRNAGVDRADAFIAVSGSDATNLMAAQVARRVYHVPKVVARVSESENAELYRYFGIETISPSEREAMELRDFVSASPIRRYFVAETAKLELIRTKVTPRAVGKRVEELSIPGQLLVSMILRGAGGLIPTPDTIVQREDEVIVALAMDHVGKQCKWLRF